MTPDEELRRDADLAVLRLRADMVEKEHWEGLAEAVRHAPSELKVYLEAVAPETITSLLDELETLRNLQQSMLQLEWQRGYDEGLNDGMDK
jgi:hypothetical protein